MSKISEQKKAKIKEDILSFLYEINPKAMFTKEVAEAVIRDEEFTKNLLLELKRDNLVNEVDISEKGKKFLLRRRWQLTKGAFDAYAKLTSR
ncbi:MAG: hypothetical protein AABW87_02690 [Nanoarchaeota archaeon]